MRYQNFLNRQMKLFVCIQLKYPFQKHFPNELHPLLPQFHLLINFQRIDQLLYFLY